MSNINQFKRDKSTAWFMNKTIKKKKQIWYTATHENHLARNIIVMVKLYDKSTSDDFSFPIELFISM